MDSQFHNGHSSYAHYPYYAPPPPAPPLPPHHHPGNPNQPLFPSSNTCLHPPGVNSYAAYTSYQQHHNQPATHVGSYYQQEPNTAQSWATQDNVRTHEDSLLPHAGYASVSSMSPAGETLQRKSQTPLEGGAADESAMTCHICNVVCNAPKAYNQHIAGKKHAIQVGMRYLTPAFPPNPIPDHYMNPVAQPPSKKAKKKKTNKHKTVQSAWCEICSIQCTDQDGLINHKIGKKHLKKLKKLQEATSSSETTNNQIISPQEEENPSSTNPVHGSTSSNTLIIWPHENPLNGNENNVESSKGKRKLEEEEEDLKAKIQRVVSGGVAEEEVRVCEVCSVVCNNEMLFKYHLAGKKHVKNVKKQAEAGAQ